MTDAVSGKILSADELAALLGSPARDIWLDAFVVPTAEELLALTEAALSDVGDELALTDKQRDALHSALREQLTGVLQLGDTP